MKRSYYKCDICKDTGWIMIPQENMQPAARSCECREREKLKNQWIKAGINPECSSLTFTNFMVWNESSRKLKDAAQAYYKNFQTIRRSKQNSILFCGQVGSGKTHIAVALGINFLKKGLKVAYMPYRDVVTDLKQNQYGKDGYYNKVISRYKNCDLLLIDDLYKGKVSDTDKSIIGGIIDYRYRCNLPIIATSECTKEGIIALDESTGGELIEMCEAYMVEVKKNKENNYRLKSLRKEQ